MQLLILHGDDILSSYKRLKNIVLLAKKKKMSIIKIGESPQNLKETLTFRNLFGEKSLFIIDHINAVNTSFIRWLKKTYKKLDIDLIIYHQGILDQNFIQNFSIPKKIEQYKLPKLIWLFLESIYPGNSSFSLKILHQVSKTLSEEYIFSLLAKHLFDLYQVKVDSHNSNFPIWKKNKLSRQLSRFDMISFSNFVSSISELDIRYKTSQIDLLENLEFTILKTLK